MSAFRRIQTVPAAAARAVLGSNITPLVGIPQRAVDLKTAAAMLGVSQKTIEREKDRGKIPAFKVGARWRILICDLENYIADRQATERARVGA